MGVARNEAQHHDRLLLKFNLEVLPLPIRPYRRERAKSNFHSIIFKGKSTISIGEDLQFIDLGKGFI